MTKTIKKHKKKTIAGASILATLIGIATMWSQVAPVLCQFTKNEALCLATGKAAKTAIYGEDGKQTLDSFVDSGPANEVAHE